MPRIRLLPSTALALALALSGCLAPHFLAPVRQADLVESKAAANATQVRIEIDDRTAARGEKGYGLQYLRVLDWENCVATLSNSNPAILPTPLTQTVAATVNAATKARTASILFTPVTPTTGYTLQLDLKRTTPGGASQIIATGSNTNFTVAAGANPIVVTLALNANGQLVVTVPQPTVGTTNVNSAVNTQSHFSAKRVAGQATAGSAAGTTPTTATFAEIGGIETDSAGNIYVADTGNNTIRKVVPAAPVVVLAGTGSLGFSGDNGAATSATLNLPRGLTRDAGSNTIFFCDSGNNRIRRIDNAGNIYTYAGGGADASATVSNALNASLNNPYGLVADQNGNLYFTERGNGRVRRIDVNGNLTTLATMGVGTVAPLAIDRTNKILWVGDGQAIKVITAIDTTPVVGSTIFTSTGASSPAIKGLAFDQVGTLYAFQSGNNGTTDTKLWRFPVTTTGTLVAGRSGEDIAGTLGTVASAAGSDVPTAAVANALTQALSGSGATGLYCDMWSSSGAGTPAGSLFFSNSFPVSTSSPIVNPGEIVEFDPSTL